MGTGKSTGVKFGKKMLIMQGLDEVDISLK